MAYLQLGDVPASSFNSTTFPGICRPSDTATLAIFKNLQAQLNRVAQGAGLSKISVDGDIGPGTLSLLTALGAWLGQGGVSVDPARNILMQAAGQTCVAVATQADTLGNAAQAVADQMSVPAKVTQPSSGTSTLVSSGGTVTHVSTPTPASASIVDSLAGMDTTTLLALAAGAGAIIYFSGKPKRGTRKSTKSSRRHARRRSNYR